jgi:hypothetical protein
MYRHLIQCLLILLASVGFAHADVPIFNILSVTEFEGDKHQEFKNDLAVRLSDGSCWKIHPKDRNKFQYWQHNDAIVVRLRTSHYYFKREHKFEFYNYHNDETVRVMLLEHPVNPLIVAHSEVYLVDQQIKVSTWVDAFGFIHYNTYTVDIYEKAITLNNGVNLIIKNPKLFAYYEKGERVYMGYNTSKTNAALIPFLISGVQREAVWVAVY